MAKTTDTNVATEKKTAGRTLKKVSATQIKLSDKPVGFEFEGRYVGTTEREMEIVSIDGEVSIKKMYTMVIEDSKGERTKFLADAGLRTALTDAMVIQGDWFKAIKGAKISLGGAKMMNTWDIFQYADNN